MKLKSLVLSFAALTSLLFTSCKEDIDLIGDAEETAVVYSLLNQADSVHFVKINRAFLSNTNSLITAQIADSNYFQNVVATVKEVVNGNVTRTWILEDTLVENKEPGAFFAPEQKLYYFKTSPTQPLLANANTVYDLEININNGEFLVTGSTPLVRGVGITSPGPSNPYAFATNNVQTIGYSSPMITVSKGEAEIMNLSLKVSFDEYIGSSFTTKSFIWKVDEIESIESNSVKFFMNGQTFYTLIKDNATNNPAITKRQINNLELIVTAGSNDLKSYITINKPSSSLAQNKPTFTNLSASNGRKTVGIFSGRSTVKRIKLDWVPSGSSNNIGAIDQNSMKELAQGTITGSLLFCTSNPNYNPNGSNPQPFFCN
ncbi:MAG: hypothetical protein E6Q37_00075 [Crocinitomicaceae bacterium]|nr:MAG: hypothetical protein E6Q37_00075 [Crocinitomicaceae bacterium]